MGGRGTQGDDCIDGAVPALYDETHFLGATPAAEEHLCLLVECVTAGVRLPTLVVGPQPLRVALGASHDQGDAFGSRRGQSSQPLDSWDWVLGALEIVLMNLDGKVGLDRTL